VAPTVNIFTVCYISLYIDVIFTQVFQTLTFDTSSIERSQ